MQHANRKAVFARRGRNTTRRQDLPSSGGLSSAPFILRSGRQIGSAPVEVLADVKGTSASALQGVAPDGMNRLQLPTGEAPETTRHRGKFIVPEGFGKAVIAELRPGATVVVAADSLRRDATGKGLTIDLIEPHD